MLRSNDLGAITRRKASAGCSLSAWEPAKYISHNPEVRTRACLALPLGWKAESEGGAILAMSLANGRKRHLQSASPAPEQQCAGDGDLSCDQDAPAEKGDLDCLNVPGHAAVVHEAARRVQVAHICRCPQPHGEPLCDQDRRTESDPG